MFTPDARRRCTALYNRPTGLRATHGLRICIAGLAALSLCGCFRRQPDTQEQLEAKLHPAKIMPLYDPKDSVLVNTGTPMQGEAPAVTVSGAVPKSGSVPGEYAKDTYQKSYILFADVYWKLNWMRKELLRGWVPYNFLAETDKAERSLQTAETHDGNYKLAAEALARIKKGLEHLACLRTLRSAHIDDLRVPWGTGAAMIQRYFDGDSPASPAPTALTPPRSSTDLLDSDFQNETGSRDIKTSSSSTQSEPLDPLHQQAEQLALSYEMRYHVSPREMMRREWELAIRATNRLRDQLDLQHRPENSDGDNNDVSVAVSQAALGVTDIPLPAGAGKTVPEEVETE